IFALWYVLRSRGARFGMNMVWWPVAITLIASGAGLLRGEAFVPFLLVGRPLIVPGILTGQFFDFYVDRPKALLTYSVLGRFLGHAAGIPPSALIGLLYYGDP